MADHLPRMKKVSRGRQKIEIKRIDKTSSRQVAFSKRRCGLFKKAGELAVLSGAEVAIVVLSERERPFSFGNPNADVVINRFLADTSNNNNDNNCKTRPKNPSSSYTRRLVLEMNKQCEEAKKVLEEEKEKGEKIEKVGEKGSLFLWELPIENLSLEELDEYKEALLEMRHNVITRANQLENTVEASNNFSSAYGSMQTPPPLFYAANNTPAATSAPAAGGNHGGFEDHDVVNENEGSCSYSNNTTTLLSHLLKQEPPIHGFIKFA